MENSKNTCSGKHKDKRGEAAAVLFVNALAAGNLVKRVLRPDGQIGIALTDLGREAMPVLDEGDDYADDYPTA